MPTVRSRRDTQRWARRGKTDDRDYGWPHQKLRQQRLAVYRPGDFCAHGGERMPYPKPIRVTDNYGTRLVSPFLDLPHNADRSGYLPGLSCRRHNRGDGQRMTTAILNARRGNVARAWASARRW